MWIPVTIAVASCALGAALGLGGRRDHSRVLVTFAVVAALAIALGQLLPDALGGAGILALLVFAGAAVLPSLLERGVARVMGQERSGRLGLELGYWALFVHRIGDGIGLGIYGGDEHAGHNHIDVLLALAAHSVPLVAFMTLAFVRRSGAAAALWRVAGLALASLIGIGLPAIVAYGTFLIEAVGGLALVIGYQSRLAALALIPIALGATWAHAGAGWVFNAEGGGWEYPLFLVVTTAVVALQGNGALALQSRDATLTAQTA